MRILGIESSCDETAAAVVEDGRRLLSNVVNTQIDIHAEYGGVVPEVAARSHLEVINPVINKALADANCTWDDIDAIAVTYAPGLIGSLLIGTLAARTLAVIHSKPIYAIHHVEAHVYANFLTEQGPKTPDESLIEPHYSEETVKSTDMGDFSRTLEGSASGAAEKSVLREVCAVRSDELSTHSPHNPSNKRAEQKALVLPSSQPKFPMLALIVSGGHSQLVFFRDHGDYSLIGQTQDDAVGEAFDKVAKILGLPYPGGPSISKAAELGEPMAYRLPIAKMQGAYDFSFSGLKTAVLRAVQREVGKDFTFPSHELPALVNDELRHNMAASFQYTAIKTLVNKTFQAYNDLSPASVVIAGGVAANLELRRQLSDKLPISIEYAPIQLCTDNAAMIATLAYYRSKIDSPANALDFEVQPSLSMMTNHQPQVS